MTGIPGGTFCIASIIHVHIPEANRPRTECVRAEYFKHLSGPDRDGNQGLEKC